jgi:hypothetical protein
MKRKAGKEKRANQRWSYNEVERMQGNYECGISCKEIAYSLNRSEKAVQAKLRKPFTDKQILKIKEDYPNLMWQSDEKPIAPPEEKAEPFVLSERAYFWIVLWAGAVTCVLGAIILERLI